MTAGHFERKLPIYTHLSASAWKNMATQSQMVLVWQFSEGHTQLHWLAHVKKDRRLVPHAHKEWKWNKKLQCGYNMFHNANTAQSKNVQS